MCLSFLKFYKKCNLKKAYSISSSRNNIGPLFLKFYAKVLIKKAY